MLPFDRHTPITSPTSLMGWFPGGGQKKLIHTQESSSPLSKKVVSHSANHSHSSSAGRTHRIGKGKISSTAPKHSASSTHRKYKHLASPAKIPILQFSRQSQTLFKQDLPVTVNALKILQARLKVSTHNFTAWYACKEFSRKAPLAAEFLKKWLSEIVGVTSPSSFIKLDKSCEEFFKLLRSSTGRTILKQLEEAFQGCHSDIEQVKRLKRFDEKSATHGKAGPFTENWEKLPKAVKRGLCYQVNVLRGYSEDSPSGLKDIRKNPKILYSLSDQNCLQNEVVRLETQILSRFSEKFVDARKKCSQSLLKVDLSKYRKEIATIENEIQRLEELQKIIRNKPKSHNEVFKKFANLSQDTSNALEHLVWVADGKPANGDLSHGFHRLEKNMGLLESIKEEGSKNSLIKCAILFYKHQLDNYQSLAELHSLKDLLNNKTKRSYSTQILLWLFNTSNREFIRDPLVKLLEEQGDSLSALKKQPRLLAIKKSSGQPSPIASLIAKKEKQRDISLHDFVKVAADDGNSNNGSAKVHDAIGVERFSEDIREAAKTPKKIALITSEYAKLYDKGGLAAAVHGLAQALAKTDNAVKVILPYYSDELPPTLKNVKKTLAYKISDGTKDQKPCKVWKVKLIDILSTFGLKGNDRKWAKKISFYMIEPVSEKYKNFLKKGYGHKDDTTRFLYFQSAAIELLHQMHQKNELDVFHGNDWQASLLAMGMHHRYPKEVPPNVLAVHNNGYAPEIGGDKLAWANLVPQDDKCKRNTLIEGMLHADQVVAVSRNFAKEIQTKEVGFGMDPYARLVAKQNRLSGIINGNNTTAHNPSVDTSLKNWIDPITGRKLNLTYSADDDDETLLSKKGLIKEQLQKWFDCYYPEANMAIDPDPQKPLFFYVGRFADQKGLDIIEPIIDKIQAEGGQLVVVGTADETMDKRVKGWLLKAKKHVQERHAGLGTAIILDEVVQHKRTGANVRKYQQGDGVNPGVGSLLRAAADFFLMPSKYEPCGLTQGEAKCYGTLFTVGTKTGGLCDTEITPEDTDEPSKITAFLCPRKGHYKDWHKTAQMQAFVNTIDQAMNHYKMLSNEERAAQMRYTMTIAKNSSWMKSHDGSLSPVDQYKVLYSAAEQMPRKKEHGSPTVRLKIGFPNIA